MNCQRQLSSSSRDIRSQLKSLTIRDLESSYPSFYDSTSINFTQESFSGVRELLDSLESTVLEAKSTLTGTLEDQKLNQMINTLCRTRQALLSQLNNIQNAFEDLYMRYTTMKYKRSYQEMEYQMLLCSKLYDRLDAQQE